VLRPVDDRDSVNLDQTTGMGERRYAYERVGWLVVPEQRYPTLFDRAQMFIAVVDDEDRELGDVLRSGAASSERTPNVGERLAGLHRQVTGTDEVAFVIFGDLTSDKDQLGSRRDDNVAVGLGRRKITGIDGFDRHRFGVSCA
jgi:hypothetical protein